MCSDPDGRIYGTGDLANIRVICSSESGDGMIWDQGKNKVPAIVQQMSIEPSSCSETVDYAGNNK